MKFKSVAFRLTIILMAATAISVYLFWLSPQARKLKSRLAIQNDLVAPWRTPISFYGKVVDEKGYPVPQAAVRFSVTDLSKEGSSEYQTHSDEKGFFALEGKQGKHLSVVVVKDGYHDFGRGISQSFVYAVGDTIHLPDRSNPVIFQLRKKGESTKLLRGYFKVNRNRDGTPVEFDLLTGKVVMPGRGHIIIANWDFNEKDDQDSWGVNISVSGGGLVEVELDNEFPFEAPADGYRPSDEIKLPHYIPQVEKAYFLRLRDSNFAYVRFVFYPRSAWAFIIRYHLNPNGSRNLERGAYTIPYGLSKTPDYELK